MTLVATAAAATACGATDAKTAGSASTGKDGLTDVTVSVIAEPGVAALYLGQSKGIFEKHGLSLKITTATGGAAIMPAVMGGQTDFGFGNNVSLLVGATKKLPVKVIAPGGYSTGDRANDYCMVLAKDGGSITKPADLAGKTVAVNAVDNIVDTTARDAVRQAGGDPASVKFAEMPFPSMAAALDKGQVDAIFQCEPFITQEKQAGGVRVVDGPFSASGSALSISEYFTSDQMIKDRPEVVKEFRDAVNESATAASAHSDEVRDIIPSFINVSPELAKSMTLPTWKPTIDTASLETLSKLIQEDGLITADPDIQGLVEQ